MGTRKYDLEERLIDFSSSVIDLVELLPNTRPGAYIAGQLIRCGLAPCFYYGEAQAAESRTDFIHKMKIIVKELKETRVCQKLIHRKNIIQSNEWTSRAIQENEELIAIISKGIITAQKNQRDMSMKQ